MILAAAVGCALAYLTVRAVRAWRNAGRVIEQTRLEVQAGRSERA